MTITPHDVCSTLGTQVGCPPIQPAEIDRLVRVLNANCRSGLSVHDPSTIDTSSPSSVEAQRGVPAATSPKPTA